MKASSFIFFVVLFFVSAPGIAQPKNSNLILVKGVTFNQVLNILLDKGYFIDKKENDIQTAKTEPKQMGNGVWNYFVQIRVRDSTAFIYGQVKFNGRNEEYSPIVNKGIKGGPQREGFRRLNEIALALKGEISYVED